MRHPFLPLVLLVVVPAAYLGFRSGAFTRIAFRWAFVFLAAAVAGAGIAAGGVDFTDLNRLKLLLAAVTIAVVGLRAVRRGGFHYRRRYRVTLSLLAAAAWLVHLNFFGFHATGSQRVYVHLHDVAHYYLGSKYAAELDYTGLYAAMLRAEAEGEPGRLSGRQARDLRSNQLLDARVVLEDSAPVRARFSAERWTAFARDVAYFREALGPQFADLFLDHGYNPTPLWTLIGGTLANLVPAGSVRGIFLLTLIDPLLLALAFLIIAWTFGLETALLAMVYFCVLFGASFGWLGGAFLRYLWFFALVVAACAQQRKRPIVAGALLATATVLRIFPAIFLLGPLCRLIATAGAERRRQLFLVTSFAAGSLLLAAATALGPGGVARWQAFRANMERHVDNTAFNTIGLTQVTLGAVRWFSLPGDLDADLAQRQAVYWIQLLTVVPLATVWFYRRSRRESDTGAMVMSIVLLFVGLNLACYYYVCLVLLILAHRSPSGLMLLFGAEVATYSLQLFEDRDAVLFFYRNVLVMLLLAALYFMEGEAAWRARRSSS
jgi:hypothetical protein